jgi:hypothetical protein
LLAVVHPREQVDDLLRDDLVAFGQQSDLVGGRADLAPVALHVEELVRAHDFLQDRLGVHVDKVDAGQQVLQCWRAEELLDDCVEVRVATGVTGAATGEAAATTELGEFLVCVQQLAERLGQVARREVCLPCS